MEVKPDMDIYFPENQEVELLESMKTLAKKSTLWQWQSHDAFGRSPDNDMFYFHRDKNNSEPPCTLCIRREEPGHFVIQNIVPDASIVSEIPVELYVRILKEFDELIAEPAAEALSGLTVIGTSEHSLKDYFSREAIRLLKFFCKTSNWSSHHPLDQKKWLAFLLYIHRNEENVHCDIFRACLRDTGWCPDNDISQLVREYDFAMQLLRQSDQE